MRMSHLLAALAATLTLAACGFRVHEGAAASELVGGDVPRDREATDADAAKPTQAADAAATLTDGPGLPYANAFSVHAMRCDGTIVAPKVVDAIATRVNFDFRQSGSPAALFVAITGCAESLATSCGAPATSCSFNEVRGVAPDLSECQTATQCQSGVCSALGDNCGQCIPPIALGDGCTAPNDFCGPGALCDGRVCVARRVKALGERCADQGSMCMAGLVCGSAKVCAAPVTVGQSCGGDVDCDEGGNNVCAGTPAGRLCTARPALGVSCTDTACATGLACDSTTKLCREPQNGIVTGLGCAPVDSCEPGSTCRFAGGWSACLPELASGQACSDDAECAGVGSVCNHDFCGAITSACAP